MTLTTAVVLAAGEGTRLRPLTQYRPKPLLPAGNRPILEHVFDALLEAGIERLIVVVGYKRDRVQDHFGPTYRDIPIEYVVQEKQLGSGHALFQVQDVVDEPFLVVNGDQIAGVELIEDTVDGWVVADADALGCLALLSATDVGDYSGVRLEDERVTAIVDRPDPAGGYHLNAGIYVFCPRIFDELAVSDLVDGEVQLPTLLTELVEQNDEVIHGITTQGLWVDATYPWDLLTVARDLLHRRAAGTDSRKNVWIDETATVHESAVVQGPVSVSADCRIGPNVVLGPATAIGPNVTIEAGAVIDSSVIDSDTRVGSNSVLRDCITGQGVSIGAGTIVDGGPGDVRVADRIFEQQPLGALLADRVTTDGGVRLEPGTLVGPGAHLHSGVTVGGTIDADADVVR